MKLLSIYVIHVIIPRSGKMHCQNTGGQNTVSSYTKGNTQKKVLCVACGFKAKSNKSLSNHKKIHKTRHTYMRTCNKCEFQGNNYQFYIHNEKVHKNVKLF